VVQTLPGARRAYAEALLEVSQLSSRNALPLPALGMAGGHPDFERRLIMIMRDRVPCRIPMLGFALIGLLALVAVPGWSLSQQAAQEKPKGKEVDKKTGEKLPADLIEVQFTDRLLQAEFVNADKNSVDSDRLDRLEKQLEALLKEVKAMRAGTPKGDASAKSPGEKAVIMDINPVISRLNVYSETVLHTGAADQAVTLTRATYKMPKDKAEALAKFLGDQVKGQVLETKVDGDSIMVTTTHIQRTIHEFINLVQGKTGQEAWIELNNKPELKDGGKKPELKEQKKPELSK
jgi:hypothetical protein